MLSLSNEQLVELDDIYQDAWNDHFQKRQLEAADMFDPHEEQAPAVLEGVRALAIAATKIDRKQIIDLLCRDFDLYDKLPVREFISILETGQTFRTRTIAEVEQPRSAGGAQTAC